MTPRLPFRPVLVLLVAGLSACGRVENEPHRFESLAERVAAIPLDGAPVAEQPAVVRAPDERGLRPALRVEVMEPHALWDARDGGLGGAIQAAGEEVAAAAAPAVVDALARDARARLADAVERTPLRPALREAEPDRRLVQLGAYASESAARAAWSRLSSGAARSALEGLSPVLEPVEVNGRRLVRLKVAAPVAGAADLCAAAGIDDPWCRQAA